MTNFSQPLSYPRAESNRNRQNRNLKFYPLNYGGNEVAKIRIFLVELSRVHGYFLTLKVSCLRRTLPWGGDLGERERCVGFDNISN